MSSPIASAKKGIIRSFLKRFHQSASHSHRHAVLAGVLAESIRQHTGDKKGATCLDVGCGDMKLAEQVGESLPGTHWTCMDIHVLPQELQEESRWKKYVTFDGSTFPFADNSYDVILFCDVLHHTGGGDRRLLEEAARCGAVVVVKDHFEYSLWSRLMLWLMDFVGNWGYGVALPRRYYSKESFSRLTQEAGLRPLEMRVGVDLYSHLPMVRNLLRKKWQFIAVLARNTPAGPKNGF